MGPDLALFGSPKRDLDENGESRRLMLAGLSLQVARQVGRINNLTLGAEVYRDEELRMELKKDSIKASPVKAGIMVGHEFILGKFLFSQQIGLYVFDKTPYYDQLFHRWGLQYRISNQFAVGFNLKAHRHEADFADLRLSYSFQKNQPE